MFTTEARTLFLKSWRRSNRPSTSLPTINIHFLQHPVFVYLSPHTHTYIYIIQTKSPMTPKNVQNLLLNVMQAFSLLRTKSTISFTSDINFYNHYRIHTCYAATPPQEQTQPCFSWSWWCEIPASQTWRVLPSAPASYFLPILLKKWCYPRTVESC